MGFGKFYKPAGERAKTGVKIRSVEIMNPDGESFSPAQFLFEIYIPGSADQLLGTRNSYEAALIFIDELGPTYQFQP